MENPAPATAERLTAAIDDFAARLAALPESSFTRRTGADDWAAAEVVGHMTEMMPYWARVAVAVAAEPGRAFGRDLADPDRIGAVQAANDRPRTEALARLRDAARQAAASIAAHSADAWRIEGVHPSRGRMTVGAVIESLVVEHAEGHIRQALESAGAPGGA